MLPEARKSLVRLRRCALSRDSADCAHWRDEDGVLFLALYLSVVLVAVSGLRCVRSQCD